MHFPYYAAARLSCQIELPSVRSILVLRYSVRSLDSGFVIKLANWFFVWTRWTWRISCWTRSSIKWRSIEMYIILECYTRLKLRWVAFKLSHRRDGESFGEKPSSLSRVSNHTFSEIPLKRPIFGFHVRSSNNLLFFWTPREGIASKEGDVSRSRGLIINFTFPIYITKSSDGGNQLFLDLDAMKDGVLEVVK